ncbi:RNA-dependent RNA polymerase [Shuangao Insect Virus 1]|uniref:RNA-directed RNA polymerase L n=1 Tax=Shuangao Insect Virus 1 TaxID=1608075 RepID=A0A0B5KF88_9VIRU|nr:RNA-dependent RNA polymerase [Shuangao Insect Virus 1]AJG39249.1 RNA-dependent RNA polymerase [Shuangao Insect Virus 1]
MFGPGKKCIPMESIEQQKPTCHLLWEPNVQISMGQTNAKKIENFLHYVDLAANSPDIRLEQRSFLNMLVDNCYLGESFNAYMGEFGDKPNQDIEDKMRAMSQPLLQKKILEEGKTVFNNRYCIDIDETGEIALTLHDKKTRSYLKKRTEGNKNIASIQELEEAVRNNDWRLLCSQLVCKFVRFTTKSGNDSSYKRVYPNQTFGLSNDARSREFLAWAGVGKSKHQVEKIDDTFDRETNKVKVLDWGDETIIESCNEQIKTNYRYVTNEYSRLFKQSPLVQYMSKIEEADPFLSKLIETACNTVAYSYLNDISDLLRGALAVSETSSSKTIRILCSASNSTYLFLYPNKSIKNAGSDLCFQTATMTTQDNDRNYRMGCEWFSVKLNNGYQLNFSKPMRLEKDKIKRLQECPFQFLITVCEFGIDLKSKKFKDVDYYQKIKESMKKDKASIDLLRSQGKIVSALPGKLMEYVDSPHEDMEQLQEIIGFSFHCAVSVTKSFMTLTEPARYIITGCSALISDVRGYIATKFEPTTKTAFSVYVLNKLKTGAMVSYKSLQNTTKEDIVIVEGFLQKTGIKDERTIDTLWFTGKVSYMSKLKEIFLPFYLNSKGLHNPVHNLLQLSKVPIELELEAKQEELYSQPFLVRKKNDSYTPENEKFSLDLKMMVGGAATYLREHRLGARSRNFRERLEKGSGFKEPITTIETMTSSKSCVSVNEDEEYYKNIKGKIPSKASKKTIRYLMKRADPSGKFKDVDLSNLVKSKLLDTAKLEEINRLGFSIVKNNYNTISNIITNYKDYTTNKVFDELYKVIKKMYNLSGTPDEILAGLKNKEELDIGFITIMENVFLYTDTLYFTLFPKNQRTAVDREIYEGTLAAKLGLYFIERIYKEYAGDDESEAISMPGESKWMAIGRKRKTCLDFLVNHCSNQADVEAKEEIGAVELNLDDQLEYPDLLKRDGEWSEVLGRKSRSSSISSQHSDRGSPKSSKTQSKKGSSTGSKKGKKKKVTKEAENTLKESQSLNATKNTFDVLRNLIWSEDVEQEEMESVEKERQEKERKKEKVREEMEALKNEARTKPMILKVMNHKILSHGILEINADMSKFSAKDNLYKFMIFVILDPNLYKNEKYFILKFFCIYLRKRLIIPDQVFGTILDQTTSNDQCVFKKMTNNFETNHIQVSHNWLQGNLNYISSCWHSMVMDVFKRVFTSAMKHLNTTVLVEPLVHSDDNSTSIAFISYNKDVNTVSLGAFAMDSIRRTLAKGSLILNTKKTNVSTFHKEFVSLHDVNSEPVSIYGRFLYPVVGDCSYLGPYEDLSARLSTIQVALKHGCPPGVAHLGVALGVQMTYRTYSMLPGQMHDPLPALDLQGESRFNIPVELGGYPDLDLWLFGSLGIEAHDLKKLAQIAEFYDLGGYKISLGWHSFIEDLTEHNSQSIHRPYINGRIQYVKQSLWMDFYIMYMKNYAVGKDIQPDCDTGLSHDMKQRSVLTMSMFTTESSIKKLESYNDHKSINRSGKSEELFCLLLELKHLLVTKAETAREYIIQILNRYYSARFLESLSIQNSTQLFLECILYSNKPRVSSKFMDAFSLEENINEDLKTGISGRYTIREALQQFKTKIDEVSPGLEITFLDFTNVLKHKILTSSVVQTHMNAYMCKLVTGYRTNESKQLVRAPNYNTVKPFNNTAAVILRSHALNTTNPLDFKRPVIEEVLKIDLENLDLYMQKTGLKNRHTTIINQLHAQIEMKSNDKHIYRKLVNETSKMYQTMYQYISQLNYSSKIFLLFTHRGRITPASFLSLLMTKCESADIRYHFTFSKDVHIEKTKGNITAGVTDNTGIMREMLSSVAHFLNDHIEETCRWDLFDTMMENWQYRGHVCKELLEKAMDNDEIRKDFMSIAYHLDKLQPADITAFFTSSKNKSIRWNSAQPIRHGYINNGPYSVTIQQSGVLVTFEKTVRTETSGTSWRPDKVIIHKPKGVNVQNIEAIVKDCVNTATIKLNGHSWEHDNLLKPRNNMLLVWDRYYENDKRFSIVEPRDYDVMKSKTYSKPNYKVGLICEVIELDKPLSFSDISSMSDINMDGDIVHFHITNEYSQRVTRVPHGMIKSFSGKDILVGSINITELIKCEQLLKSHIYLSAHSLSTDIPNCIGCDEGANDIDITGFTNSPVQVPAIVEASDDFSPSVVWNVDPYAGMAVKSFRSALMQVIQASKENITKLLKNKNAFDISETRLNKLSFLCYLGSLLGCPLPGFIHLRKIVHNYCKLNTTDNIYHESLGVPEYYTNPEIFADLSRETFNMALLRSEIVVNSISSLRFDDDHFEEITQPSLSWIKHELTERCMGSVQSDWD